VSKKGFQKLEPGMSVMTGNLKIAPLNIHVPPAPKKARGKFKPSKQAPRRNLGPWFGENATTTAPAGNSEQQHQTSHLAYLREMVDLIPSPPPQQETYPTSSKELLGNFSGDMLELAMSLENIPGMAGEVSGKWS